MSITYAQALGLCREIAPIIVGATSREFLLDGSQSFLLTFSLKNSISALRICLEKPFVRFHMDSPSLPKASGKDPFVEAVDKVVKGAHISACELLNDDRILSLTFQKDTGDFRLIVELFPSKPNAYLLNDRQDILASWRSNGDLSTYTLPQKAFNAEVLPDIFPPGLSASIAQDYALRESKETFEKRYKEVFTNVNKSLKRAEQRLQQREAMLQASQEWEAVQHEGQLLHANLFRLRKGLDKVLVEDWNEGGKERCIELDPLMEPYVQINKRFQRAKKLRSGIKHAQKQVLEVTEEVQQWQSLCEALKEIRNLPELEAFCAANKFPTDQQKPVKTLSQRKEPRRPYHIYQSAEGVQLWVGKSAKDNDQLTFLHARGSDWWLHAHDYPGSHVVIRLPKDKEPSSDTLADAVALAAHYSKMTDKSAGEVCLTQVKYLKRIKASPGKVTLSKHKILHFRHDEARWLRLKEQRLG